MDKFKKKIQEQAKEKMSESGGDKKSDDYKNRVSPNEEKRSGIKIHTDKELAKMSIVEVGTVARYNRVMNSKDEDSKLLLSSEKEQKHSMLYDFWANNTKYS